MSRSPHAVSCPDLVVSRKADEGQNGDNDDDEADDIDDAVHGVS